MKKYLILYILICFISCTSQKEPNILATFELKHININNNFSIGFRDSTSQIDWDWFQNQSLTVVPDSFIITYFNNISELQKWKGYQECSLEGYQILNDSSQLLIVNNRILNGNEANKYLIRIEKDRPIDKVFLLAKVEKSIDDIFEIYSFINNGKILQTHTHIFIDGDSIITDKIAYEFTTNDFIHFKSIKKDSIRIIELE